MIDNSFSVEEVADKLGVHKRTVRRYIASGELLGHKVGGKWKVSKEDLTGFMNGIKGGCRGEGCENIKEDDLCVFMDTEYYKSRSKVQICSIVDIDVENKSEASRLSEAIIRSINAYGEADESTKFQYVYKDKERKARIVIWGSSSFIEYIMGIIGSLELHEEVK